MKEFYNNLQAREKTLLQVLISIIFIGIIVSITSSLYSNLQDSSQRLKSSKADYEYVSKQAEILSLNLAQQGFLANAEATYTKLDSMSENYGLINFVRTSENGELKIVYILNDLEKSLMFIEDSIKLIGITPESINVSRLNEIKRFTIIFSI